MNVENRFAGVAADALSEEERESVVTLASEVMATEVATGPVLEVGEPLRKYLQLKSARLEREVFGCMFLTARDRLIRTEELFFGSVDRSRVYGRVVLQRALACNAAAVIFWHNHPSGSAEPSNSDRRLTVRVRKLLEEVDVRLVDHLVVSRTETVSMAERGWI